MEPRYGGLEDAFPFQLGDVSYSMLISGGAYYFFLKR